MTVTVPETVAPEAGEVIEMVGGAVTVFFTVIETAVLVAVWRPRCWRRQRSSGCHWKGSRCSAKD